MRILYLSPWFPHPLDNGFRIRVYHLLRALAQRHQVTLVTLEPQDWAPAQVEAVAPLCKQAAVVQRDPFQRGRLRTLTRFFSLRPVVNAPFQEMTRLVRRLHAEQPFDVIIAAGTIMAHYALALPDVPCVLEEHNSHTRWLYERYQAQASPLQRLRCWASWRKSALYESRLFRRFALVTMVSEEDAGVSRNLLPDGRPPVEVVRNGVDYEQFCPDSGVPQPNSLIFNGPLTYDVNYDAMRFFLQRVYPHILSRCPGVRLRITGSTKGVDLDSLPLDESVILTGFLEDIHSAVASSWVAVAPILSGGGTRHKILEALAAGTPIVSTSKGAEGLDVVDEEHVLLADDPAAFADRTVQVLRNPVLRQRLATNARRLVEQHYGWRRIGERFVDLTEEVASRHTRGHVSS